MSQERVRARRSMIALCASLLLSAVALAQGGSAKLELRVVDEGGQGVAQAAILMRPETDQPVALPPPFFSDEDGHVSMDGLPEGEWQIEVRAGGYMIFTGYLKLIAGLPPVVGFTTKQRTGSFWAPMDVVFGGTADLQADDLARAAKDADKGDRKGLKRAEKKLRKDEKRQQELEERRAQAAADAEDQQYRGTGGAEVAVLKPSPVPGAEEEESGAVAGDDAVTDVADSGITEGEEEVASLEPSPTQAQPQVEAEYEAEESSTILAEDVAVVVEEDPVVIAAVDSEVLELPSLEAAAQSAPLSQPEEEEGPSLQDL